MIKKSKINNLNAIEYIPKKFNKIIILSHGFLMDKEGPNGLFKELAERLYKLNYKVIRYDFSFSQNSSDYSRFSLSAFNEDILKIISYAKKSKKEIILIGHSLGAYISILNCNNASKSILLSPPLKSKTPPFKQITRTYNLLNLNPFSLLLRYFKQRNDFSILPIHTQIKVPTLLIYGTQDQVVSYSKINKVNSPYIIIKKIDGMDHFYKNHKPIIIKEILKFLKTE